jgi:hypothetical protein
MKVVTHHLRILYPIKITRENIFHIKLLWNRHITPLYNAHPSNHNWWQCSHTRLLIMAVHRVSIVIVYMLISETNNNRISNSKCGTHCCLLAHNVQRWNIKEWSRHLHIELVPTILFESPKVPRAYEPLNPALVSAYVSSHKYLFVLCSCIVFSDMLKNFRL